MRLLPLLVDRFRVFALTSQAPNSEHARQLRAAGAIPMFGDLDHPASLGHLAQLASRIVHLAPPHSAGEIDQRTRRLVAILPDKSRFVYVSTTGVYGDCGGELFDETRAINPQNSRAKRRVAAENSLRTWARRASVSLSILRVPGIYAADRLPLKRIQKGLPALVAQDDVYTNHIHADDLAQLIFLALFRGKANRLYHAVDDSDLKMADYFDLVAARFGMQKPPRLPREELVRQVSPMLLSFMSESRRLKNSRIKQELGVRLRYPTVLDGLAGLDPSGN